MCQILFVVPNFPPPVVGGLEKQAYILSKTLIRKGINVSVLTRASNNKVVDDYYPKVYRIPFVFQKFKLIEVLFVLFFFLRFYKRFDIIHVHQHSWFGIYVSGIALFFRRKVLLKLPNIGAHGILSVNGKIKRFIVRRVNGIIAMNNIQRQELDSFGYDGQIISIPNGIELDSEVNERFPEKFDLTTQIRFISIGRLVEQKGLDFLLDAWVKFKDMPNVLLEIWGEGPLKKNLIERIEFLNYKNVRLCGYTSDPLSEMMKSNVYLNTSMIEGMSNAILEAMSCSLMVIASDVGGAREQLPKGDFIFEYGDIERLQELISKCIESPGIIFINGTQNREKVYSDFNIDKVADQYMRCYGKL